MSKPLNTEEAEFLNGLLSDFDHLSPHHIGPAPARALSSEDVDMEALVHGAEDWDWGDMEADFLTPKKDRTVKSDKVNPPHFSYAIYVNLSMQGTLASIIRVNSV
jgi:hypothetical protein